MNCQLKFLDENSEKNTWFSDKLQYSMRKYRYYRKKILVTLRSIKSRSASSQINQDEINEGDIVKVLSKTEIKNTLDRFGKIRGCSFLKGMYDDCDKQFKVYKKLEYFFDETRQRMLKSNSLYFLEGSYCDGRSAYLKPCDRHCFYFWHKNWLKKL